MAYIGVQPTDTYLSIASQQITGTGSATYTLDYSVSNEEDVAVFVNNVRQNVSTYTVSGTSLTLGGTISASDSCWILFLGRTVGTKTPAVGSVTNDMLAGSIANSKISNLYPYRNLIINGDMSIAQRGTSATSVSSSGYHSLDRFLFGFNETDELVATISQDTDVPSGQGFANSMKFQVTTPETTLATDEILQIIHRMEGQNTQHLKYGTSSAESLTLSFWVKSSITGRYVITFKNNDPSAGTRLNVNTYTINSANTWEKKTITITGDTTANTNFVNTNAKGLELLWSLASGGSYQGTSSSGWTSYDAQKLFNGQSANVITTSGATWLLTGVQLEVGTSASDFEFLPYDVNLQRCQRYYFEINPNGANGGPVYPARTNGGFDVQNIGIDCPVPLRIGNPSITIQSGTIMQVWANTFSQTSAGGGSVTGLVDTGSNSNRLMVNTNGFSGLTGNISAVWGPILQSMPVDAEL